jgi:6-phosphogluconolactonase
MEQREIEVLPSSEALFGRGAEEFLRLAKAAASERGVFSVVLSGGSTPKGLFQLLASTEPFRSEVPWSQIHFFWADERHVAPDHSDSNFRMAWESLFSKVPVSPENLHRIRGEMPDAREAAAQYETDLRRFFNLAEDFPHFDLVLLGMGADGHTASLFPGSEALQECGRWVVGNWVEKFKAWRITLTIPVFNNAETVIFLVSGADKGEALRAVLAEEAALPAQLIRPVDGRLLWLVDQPV